MVITEAMRQAAEQREAQLASLIEEIGMPVGSVEYCRPPSGPGYKELGLQQDWNWKRYLRTAPFELPKWYELTFVYTGSKPRSIAIMRLTEGCNDYYLRAWCLRDNRPKTFSLHIVGPTVTGCGEVFESGASWMNSLPRLF